MKSSPVLRGVFSIAALALSCVAGHKVMAQAPGDENTIKIGDFQFGGLLDAYYQYDFNRPSFGASLGNSGRLFDASNNSFTLAAARLNILRAPKEHSPIGVTIQLLAGANADLLNAYEPGGVDRDKSFQQAYGTYRGSGSKPVTVDLGKFAAWIGYESLDSVDNENYSRSFNFNLGEPNYTAGLRASRPITEKGNLAGTVYIVNGFNETEDSNGGKTVGAQLSGSPVHGLNISLLYWGGPEGSEALNGAGGYGGINFASPGTLNVNTGNIIATYQTDGRTHLAFDGYYTDAASGRRTGGAWNGQAAYLRRQISRSAALAVRVERFEDFSGLRTGERRQLHSATATYEYVVGPRGELVNRIEFRQDFSSDAYFDGGGDEDPRKRRATLTYSAVFRF